MARVEVRDGRPVAVRTGGDELRREAALLRRLAGAGVPEVLALDDDGGEVRLVTAVAPPVPAADLLAVGAEVAAILARAHEQGVVHGPLREEHVQGAPGAVLVAGWEVAGAGTPAADVAELGRLLEPHAGSDARARAAVARALAPDPPSMAAFAESLRAAPPPTGRGGRAPLPLAVLAGLAVALALVAAGLLVDDGRPAPAPAAAVTDPEAAPTTSTSTSTTALVRVEITGNVVERDGERWTVGRPGDVVVVGNWNCDGDPTPAVFRPATGEVWVFAGWTAAGVPAAGRSLGSVAGATSVRARHAGRCDRLEVVGPDGQSTTMG